jgi:hypothetical protein
MKTTSFALSVLFSFCALTCKKETPVAPSQSSEFDTTSHAWKFTITLLGGASGSALYDAFIVNNSTAYAVGEIYSDSSVEFGYPPSVIAKWDGTAWNFSPLNYLYQGQSHPISSLSGMSMLGGQFWLAGGGIFKWDGVSYQAPLDFSRLTLQNQNATIEKVQVLSNVSVYGFGTFGTIVSYNGSAWEILTNTSNLNVQDIYGNGGTVLAVTSYPGESLDKDILQISGTTVTQLSTNPIQWPLTSAWFVPGHFYVVGRGIYKKTSLSDNLWQQDPIDTVDFFSCIRGNAWNDFFAAGGYGQLLHFNGKSWQSYQNVIGMQSGAIARIAVKGNLMIAVGQLGSKAVAIVGRREN